MKRSFVTILVVSFIAFALADIADSWQGRMAGFGDPYGLVEDESDLLIHPALIAGGKGTNYYLHNRLTYRDVGHWNLSVDEFNRAGALIARFPFETSGEEKELNSLLGTAFPVGKGRMGLFAEYTGLRGFYEGRENQPVGAGALFHQFNMGDDLDTVVLRLLYGLPVNKWKIGAEVQLGHVNEERENEFIADQGGGNVAILTNFPEASFSFAGFNPELNLFPFMIPYRSKYWELLLKGSVHRPIGPSKLSWTVWSGFILSGNNRFEFTELSGLIGFKEKDGEIKGWRIGTDLFWRFALGERLWLPLMLRAGYQRKERNGTGIEIENGAIEDVIDTYRHGEKVFRLEGGAGIDRQLCHETRVSGGIYYGYFRSQDDFVINFIFPGAVMVFDRDKYPLRTEHRATLRLVGARQLSPLVGLKAGLNLFYGRMKEDYRFDLFRTGVPVQADRVSLEGPHWGIAASIGTDLKFRRFTLEPFMAVGYKKLKLDGNGLASIPPAIDLLEVQKLREEWIVSTGLSFRF